ncbi:hypothetical protein A5717_04540 [Mycolicibacterium porcinum]|uniref:hypothetical protein n=1 Tax=Mycolicibacterium porcinum TaxID=39693 RepID=UPI00080BE3FF|nr:hypothetical protein [Mycolicibacterium porcinum]OCB16651.1 hypothetical protein A5717_04540 [Mycolicibacterium porcinum]
MAGPRGSDGANKVDGVKRHELADSARVLVAAVVTKANVGDRAAIPKPLRKTKRIAPTICHAWVEKGYTEPNRPTTRLDRSQLFDTL